MSDLLHTIVFAILVTGLAAVRPTLAQEAPFSTVTVAVSVSQDVNQARFQDDWDTAPAIDVSAAFPFYYGTVRAGARVMQAHSRVLTDINSAFFNVAWGPQISLGARTTLEASIAAGTMYMSFTEEQVSFRRSESELALGLRAAVATRIRGPLHVQVWGEWQRAFTSVPLDFVYFSAGIRYDFATPDWLRRFLN